MDNLIATTDLTVIDGKACVPDMRLASALGFSDPHKIRSLIKRNAEELSRYGEVSATVAETTAKGGRPSIQYALNEPQALLITMFSRTERAADARAAVIAVFQAWRNGTLPELEAARPDIAMLKRGRGRPSGGRIFDDATVLAIRSACDRGERYDDIAAHHGVSSTAIRAIHNGKTYRNVVERSAAPAPANDTLNSLIHLFEDFTNGLREIQRAA